MNMSLLQSLLYNEQMTTVIMGGCLFFSEVIERISTPIFELYLGRSCEESSAGCICSCWMFVPKLLSLAARCSPWRCTPLTANRHTASPRSPGLPWSSRTAAALIWLGQGAWARLCWVDVLVRYSLYCSFVRRPSAACLLW